MPLKTEGVRPKCYVASPYGFAASTKGFYESEYLPAIQRHVDVLDPWMAIPADVLQEIDATIDPKKKAALLVRNIGRHHLETIRSKADLLVAALDQEPPDVGTVLELGYAAGIGIPVLGYKGDFRVSGEGAGVNLMLPAAIDETAGDFEIDLVSTIPELEERLAYHAELLMRR